MKSYQYKELSKMLGFEIKTENQYQLALAGACKETVEANKVNADDFYLTEEYKKLYSKSPAEIAELLSRVSGQTGT